jgi:hypothetical protein
MLKVKQKIYQPPGFVQELILPPDPQYWIRPKGGEATLVAFLGETPPELVELARLYGWVYDEREGKFYPA